MAKGRNYQKEYARRIARGLERGLTKSQSSGHPRGEELSAKQEFNLRQLLNPFDTIKKSVNEFMSEVNRVFEPLTKVPSSADPYYIDRHGRVLERWAIGDDEHIPNKASMEELWDTVNDKRQQSGYAITVTGMTEDPYPGKYGELFITLSYRLNRNAIEQALNNPNNRTINDIVNSMIPSSSQERWLSVNQVTIIDKD